MQSEAERRTRHVSVRFTPKEYAELDAQARAAALEVSALVRKIILNAPIPARAKHRSPDIAALGRALAALNRIGSNINQIAKVANTTGQLSAYLAAQQDRARLAETAMTLLAAIETIR